MKKVFIYFVLLAACVSCKISSHTVRPASNLSDYASRLIMENEGQANACFFLIQCAQRYLNYDGPDRELQWFSRYVSASQAVNVITIKLNELNGMGQTVSVHTNSLPFDTPGAVYEIHDFTFTCVSNEDNPLWIVKGKNFSSQLEITASDILGIEYKLNGYGSDKSSTQGLVSDYDFNFLYNWKFSVGVTSLYDFTHENLLSGNYQVSIKQNGKEIDWVKASLSSSSSNITTSRD